jgi:SAM-dependent methyltransferase
MSAGARPQGTADEAASAVAVRQMFNSIAPRYDLLNRLLSGNVAALWWRRAARTFREILAMPESCIVDLCCGTGSLTLELEKFRAEDGAPILAMDFSHAMLALATPRLRKSIVIEADGMHLPLADALPACFLPAARMLICRLRCGGFLLRRNCWSGFATRDFPTRSGRPTRLALQGCTPAENKATLKQFR